MSESTVVILIQLVALLAWIYSVIQDASNNVIGWLIVDILLPPIGVIRGLYLFFT